MAITGEKPIQEQHPDWAADDKEELPPKQEFFDANGYKNIIEWSINAEGYAVKSTKIIKITRTTKKVSKGIARRKNWKKFGMAKNSDDGITAINLEDINIEWLIAGHSDMATAGELAAAEEEELARQADTDIRKRLQLERFKRRMEERKAGVDNWAQLMALQAGAQKEDVVGTAGVPGTGTDGNAGEAGASGDSASKPGKYVPPSLRNRQPGGDSGESSYQRDDSATLRVSNISPNTTEADLQELFRPFGPIRRIFLSRDRVTGENKGFAFVAFINVNDAAKCIEKLDGYGYDHLILRVDWSRNNQGQGVRR